MPAWESGFLTFRWSFIEFGHAFAQDSGIPLLKKVKQPVWLLYSLNSILSLLNGSGHLVTGTLLKLSRYTDLGFFGNFTSFNGLLS